MNGLAAACSTWPDFIVGEYQDDMYYRRTLAQDDTIIPYKCPSCDAKLRKLSSIFEHVESDSCGQELDDPIIRRLQDHLALHV
jgi:hypothetical protein